MDLNGVLNGPNSCFVYYIQSSNAIYLFNDAANALIGPLTPGSAASISNSQCTVQGTGSSMSGSGNTLTLVLNLTLTGSFGATQNVFMYAFDNGGLNSAWNYRGTTAAMHAPPTADSVTGIVNGSLTQTLTFKASSVSGYSYLENVYFLMNGPLSGTGACWGVYVKAVNGVYLADETGSGLLGPLTLGAGSLSNSRCTLNGVGSSVSGSGNTLTLVLKFTFSASFGGAQNIFLYAADAAGFNSGWQKVGTSAPFPNTPPTADSVTGIVNGSLNQTLTFNYTDVNGFAYLYQVYAVLNSTLAFANDCVIIWDKPSQSLFLVNDAVTALIGPLALGANQNINNTQCTLHGLGSMVNGVGNSFALTVSLTLTSMFGVNQNVFIQAQDGGALLSAYNNVGKLLTNTQPTANAQSVITNESTAKPITLTGNDNETASANLTFTITQAPTHGMLSGSGASQTYTPTGGYFGADSFQFKVTDRGAPDNCGAPGPNCVAALDSAVATVSITVSPVNTAPTAIAQSVSTTTNTNLPITLTGSDTETPAANLTFTVTTPPTHGMLTGSGASLTYNPTAGYSGLDSFQFKVTDRGKPDNCGVQSPTCAAALDSTPATVSIAVNQAPTITSTNNTTFAPGKTGQSFSVTTTGFPTGASMMISETGTLPTGVSFTDNHNGTATINGTPAAGTQGSTGNPVTKAYAVTLAADNGIPSAASQSFTLNITCPVITVSGTTPLNLIFNTVMSTSTYMQAGGNGTIVWSASGLPTGVSIGSANGQVTGTPSVTGTFGATITATDAGGCTGTKAVTLNVAPNITAQSYTGVGNTQFFITGVSGAPTTPAVSSSTTLLNGATPAGQVAITTASCTAGATLSAVDATGHFIFTPNVNTTSVTCTYTASSNTGSGVGSSGPATATASINFTINNMVWYVDNATGASTNDGRSNTPFKTMTAVGTTPTAGHYIYVAKGSGNTTGSYTMLANQTLAGSGATFTIGPLTITGSVGNSPTLSGTLSASNVTGLTVQGISMSTGSSTAVSLSNNADGNFTFESISTSSAPHGILWDHPGNAATGSFTVTGNGGTCTTVTPTCTGGSIQSSSSEGILMNRASNVSLSFMKVQNTVSPKGSGGVSLTDTTGTLTLSNDLVTGTTASAGNGAPNMHVFTSNNSAAVITTLTVTNGEYNNSALAEGFLIEINHDAAINTGSITGTIFSGNAAYPLDVVQNSDVLGGTHTSIIGKEWAPLRRVLSRSRAVPSRTIRASVSASRRAAATA